MRAGGGSIAAGAVACLMSLPGSAAAQWSPDSLQNLMICDLTGEQVLPRIAATSDGGCFISWFDARSGSYDLYLQRLDSLGIEQFGDDGLLVSDHPQQTWLVDYDLAIDGDDNAVIVFSDTRNSPDELDVSAYMIGSDGSFQWGPDGKCLSDTTVSGMEAAASVAVTPDGNSVFAWGMSGSDYTMIFQKLSPSGFPLWGAQGIDFDDPVRSLTLPTLVPSVGDNVIALWKSSTGSFPYPTTHLYVGMLDTNGDLAWGDTPILIYDSGHISGWTAPELAQDGDGGAICSWYDAPDLSSFNVWVQHIDAGGNMLFPMNGASASLNSENRLHMYPSSVRDPVGGNVLVFWVEENDNQNQYGICGQKFSSSGARLWTDSGLQLVPLGSTQISFVRALADQYGVFIAFCYGDYSTALRVMRIGYDGSIDWGPVTLSASSLGGKDDLVTCPSLDQSALYSWSDNRTDTGVYAQGVDQDGTLGPSTGIGHGQGAESVSLFITPNPSGGSSVISFTLDSAGLVTLDVFDMAGRLMETVVSGQMQEGTHTVTWSGLAGPGASAGVYLVRLAADAAQVSARMVVLR